MTKSLLQRVFQSEHHELGVDSSVQIPLFMELEVESNIEPILSSNMKGEFLRTRCSAVGRARYAFCACPIEYEHELFVALYRAILAGADEWGVASSCEAALEQMGKGARFLVGDAGFCVPESVTYFQTDFPTGCALLIGAPPKSGQHTRIGDYVGVIAAHVDTSFCAIVAS